MTPRRSQPIESDVPMFTMEELLPEPLLPPEPDYTFTVNVKERAESLDKALASLAQANMRGGLIQASEGDPHRIDLQARYQSNLNKVVEGATRNRADHASTALYHFRHASGYWAMNMSGVVDREQLDKSTLLDFQAFKAKYTGGPDQAKKRNEYRQDLQAQAGLIKPIKRRRKKIRRVKSKLVCLCIQLIL